MTTHDAVPFVSFGLSVEAGCDPVEALDTVERALGDVSLTAEAFIVCLSILAIGARRHDRHPTALGES